MAKALDIMQIDYNGKEETWVMKHNAAFSIEHEVWVRKIRDYVSSIGSKVYIVDTANGPDVVALSNGSKYAIEYETGKKDLYATKLMIDSRSGKFKKTIVVVNENSYEKYKEKLEREEVPVITIKEMEKLRGLLEVVS